jgi:hypothetical protein
MGGPKWDTKRPVLVPLENPARFGREFVKTIHVLQDAFVEVLKAEFIEQCNTIRNLAIGKSRYGCPERGQLDIVMGCLVPEWAHDGAWCGASLSWHSAEQ